MPNCKSQWDCFGQGNCIKNKMFSFLCFRTKILLPSQDNSSRIGFPRIAFPYYPKNAKELAIFNEFQDSFSEDPNLTTLSVDCLKHRTYCAKYNFVPGKLYVSIFDHESPVKIEENVTYELLQEIIPRAKNHGYIKVNSESEISALAAKKPLFLFVSRPNAGDLPQKKPVFTRLSSHYIGKNMTFAYSTNNYVYEKYANYPHVAFVYVAPSGGFLTYRGNFQKENVDIFIRQHAQPVLSEKVLTRQKAITVVGNSEFYDTANKTLADFQTKIPIVYVDSKKNLDIASKYCNGKYQCIAIVDYYNFRAVQCTSEEPEQIESTISSFDEIWNSYPWTQKISTIYYIATNVHETTYYMILGCTFLFIFNLILMRLDRGRIIQ